VRFKGTLISEQWGWSPAAHAQVVRLRQYPIGLAERPDIGHADGLSLLTYSLAQGSPQEVSMYRHKCALVMCLLIPVLHQSSFAQAVPRSPELPSAAPKRLDGRFALTPTQNIWTFLLLDSSNGRLWQIQYALSDSAFRGRLPINNDPLVPPASAHAGRFIVQETQNVYNFLLLDQDDGRLWQVQWSHDEDQRGIWVLSPPAP
jgi:hypothetical protein